MGKTPSILVISVLWIVYLARETGSTVPAGTEFLLRGIAPSDESYYKGLLSSSSPSATIKCKDGSKKFSKSQLNDDFCDCHDASDEPGTSACPHGNFFCQNAGHVSLSLYSSRVNDGICDCCDGSDEYDGKIKCSNTCWEAGKVARDKLQKKIAVYQEGVTIRKRDIEKAKSSLEKDEAELQKLKSEEKILKGLVQQLKDHKERIDEAEEKERLEKEKEEKEIKEAEEASQKKQEAEQSTETITGEHTKDDNNDRDSLPHESPSKQDITEDDDDKGNEATHTAGTLEDGFPKDAVEPIKEDSLEHASKQEEEPVTSDKSDIASENQDVDGTENTTPLSKEELGRLVASRWTGEKNDQQTEDVKITEEEKPESQEETPKDEHEEEYSGYESESEDSGSNYEDDIDTDADAEDPIEGYDTQDHDDSGSFDGSESYDEPYLSDLPGSKLTWLEKIQATVLSIFQAVNLFQSPIDKSDAARIRKEYDESNTKLTKLQSRISSLTNKLKHDFGPEKEFYSFYGQCFENKQNKYVYKICPYKQATQVEGHSTTRLGNWDNFEDSYKYMKFSSGDKCWNGPDRSLKVKLRCGLNNDVSDVDEPSRCEYVALLSTPALCLEDTLKELETKLDMMNNEQPLLNHDEL